MYLATWLCEVQINNEQVNEIKVYIIYLKQFTTKLN